MYVLADKFSWTKEYILKDVFIDELILYKNMIELKDVETHLANLQIAHNPFSKKPTELFSLLNSERDKLMRAIFGQEDDGFDRQGFQLLKQKLVSTGSALRVITPRNDTI